MSSDSGGGIGIGGVIVILMLLSALGGNDDDKKKPKATETKVQVEQQADRGITEEKVKQKAKELLEKAKRAADAAKREFSKAPTWAGCVDQCEDSSDIRRCREACMQMEPLERFRKQAPDDASGVMYETPTARKMKPVPKEEKKPTKKKKEEDDIYDYNEWEDSR